MTSIDQLRALKSRHSTELLRRPGVVGVDIDTESRELVVHLSSDSPAIRASLPTEIEGYAIRYVHSGPFEKQ